jgi:hypothetical protein
VERRVLATIRSKLPSVLRLQFACIKLINAALSTELPLRVCHAASGWPWKAAGELELPLAIVLDEAYYSPALPRFWEGLKDVDYGTLLLMQQTWKGTSRTRKLRGC